jgi:hypothetical protein
LDSDHVRIGHAHDRRDEDAGDDRLDGERALEVVDSLEQRDFGGAIRRRALGARVTERVFQELGRRHVGLVVAQAGGDNTSIRATAANISPAVTRAAARA